MAGPEVRPEQVYERCRGPRMTVRVKQPSPEHADWWECRMYRESGSALPGLRPVPASLLLSEQFRLLEPEVVE